MTKRITADHGQPSTDRELDELLDKLATDSPGFLHRL
jgi:hypothetical protein